MSTQRKQTLRQSKRLKIKSLFRKIRKRFKESRHHQKVRLMHQDEAGFGRISKQELVDLQRGNELSF